MARSGDVRIAAITRKALDEASRRGRQACAHGAKSVRLEGRKLVISMGNGAIASIDVASIPYRPIATAPPKKLKHVEVSGLGEYIWFPDIDEGYSVPALLELGFGPAIRSYLGKRGGKKSTAAKARAARANGRKGGRPRKKLAAA